MRNDTIPDEIFIEQGVNRGLRDINGRGVLTGLTNISAVNAEIDAVKSRNAQLIQLLKDCLEHDGR